MRLRNRSLMLVSILIIAATLVSFEQQTVAMASPRSIIYDSRFIPAMNNLSSLVPGGAVLVVSTNAPFVTYFTNHIARLPIGVSSAQGLSSFMMDRGYMYLVVFENRSDVPQLRALFSSKGVKALESAFIRIAAYQTDFSLILVYQLKSS